MDVQDGASAIADAVLAQPLDRAIVGAIARERDRRERLGEDATHS